MGKVFCRIYDLLVFHRVFVWKGIDPLEDNKISVTLDKQNDIEINYNFCMYQINIGGIAKILSNRNETAKLVSLQILNYEITWLPSTCIVLFFMLSYSQINF